MLYAPTWREDQLGFDNILRLNLQLDLAAAKTALSQDQVLLVRPHPRVGQIAPGAGDGYLWDVADYPDAQDLHRTHPRPPGHPRRHPTPPRGLHRLPTGLQPLGRRQ
ncbi:CDP-glycerol glycerophosphotransferase family protein, partial [Streptacidiphilus jeojiense]|uniref:CDP-glycerol glycerophosphotransferase family protein n=1 Tax=Streptacidiphilus jeojiense TaxID=436229 RepID=UPI0038CDC41B